MKIIAHFILLVIGMAAGFFVVMNPGENTSVMTALLGFLVALFDMQRRRIAELAFYILIGGLLCLSSQHFFEGIGAANKGAVTVPVFLFLIGVILGKTAMVVRT